MLQIVKVKCKTTIPFIYIFIVFFGLIDCATAANELKLKDILEKDSKSKEVVTQKIDEINENKLIHSPLTSLIALKQALENSDYATAAKYFDLRKLPQGYSKEDTNELIRKLVIVWTQQNLLDVSTISDAPAGNENDGLPEGFDLLGQLQSKSGTIDVYFQHIQQREGSSWFKKGERYWKISNDAILKTPELWEEFGYPEYIEQLSSYLPKFSIFGMQNWQATILGFAIVLLWLVTGLIRTVLLKIVSYSERYRDITQRLIRVPVRMFMFFSGIEYTTLNLGLSLKSRIWVDSGIIWQIALTFLYFGIIEFIATVYAARSKKHQYSLALIRPLVTTLKIFVFIYMVLSWMQASGYNITTAMTGLGIGSLALAMASKATLENVIGAVTLLVAKPVKPGDFCTFGSVSGVVEEIGLRTTRIRTKDRKVVHVPNSVVASENISNNAEVERRLFKKQLFLSLQTTPDQLRQLLINFRKLLISHPQVMEKSLRVRFEDIGRDAFVFGFNAFIDTDSKSIYREVQEDLNLSILEILQEHGIRLAVPEQRITIAQETELPTTHASDAETYISELKENNILPFPNFTAEEVNELLNTKSYPPVGSPEAAANTELKES